MPSSNPEAELNRVFSASNFVSSLATVFAPRFSIWSQEDRWDYPDPPNGLVDRVAGLNGTGTDEPTLLSSLRRLRQREMTRIVVRAISKDATLDETLHALSDLAEACCASAVDFAFRQLSERHGIPRDAQGEAVQPLVLGMGKLGGRELNFSSDIDLIFGYTASGRTDGQKPISNDEFFAKLVQRVIRLLSERTPDGFVFRVDTLLRPFGSVGAPASSAAAMEDYYQSHGREWERYALIKARPIAGDLDAGFELLEALQPFIYRRYLDFSALGNLRDLKRSIDEEAAKRGAEDDLKLGPGGIRELEFIVQLFQLMRGGQDARLRDTRLRPVLRFLGESGQLPSATARALDDAYVYLRRSENAVQMYADEQTHRLPVSEKARHALCVAMDQPNWSALKRTLDAHRAVVREEFDRIFAQPGKVGPSRVAADDLLSGNGSDCEAALLKLGFSEKTDDAANAIRALFASRLVRGLGDKSHTRLNQVLHWLTESAAATPDPSTALIRALRVLSSLAGRGTYIALLYESAAAREQLVRLTGASPWITDLLALNPALLDALLDSRTAADVPDRTGFRNELAYRLAAIRENDTEAQLDLLRRFRQEMMLRIAAADLSGRLPLVEVSNRLTWLAESIVGQAVDFARAQATSRLPRRANGAPADFAVIAYGKFGSLELGYGSDLDLVFVYEAASTKAGSDDPTSGTPPAAHFTRLAQRIVMLLSTLTGAGRAYEVDLQLRPSGNSGLVVTSLAGFGRYQRESAWTWEHQALLRARVVTGDPALAEAIEGIRREVLQRVREPAKLRCEVLDMRKKMRDALEKQVPEKWDVKQAAGGLIDAEFLTQFLCLRDAASDPALIEFTDNWRQLEALTASGHIASSDRDALLFAERSYRGFLHRRALQQQDGSADEAQFTEERAAVSARWNSLLENI